MNRPEGISESAWSMAKQLTSAEYDSYAHQVIETAAAIQSAVEAERSRCAELAEDYDGDGMEASQYAQLGDAYVAKRDIADLIRKGA